MEQRMYTLRRDLYGRGYEFTVVALVSLGKGKKILDDLGVPAIATPINTIPDMVIAGCNGFLVQRTTGEIAGALENVWTLAISIKP